MNTQNTQLPESICDDGSIAIETAAHTSCEASAKQEGQNVRLINERDNNAALAEDLEQALRKVTAQRDELLAACQSVANGPKPQTRETQNVWIDSVRKLARAAIANAEESK